MFNSYVSHYQRVSPMFRTTLIFSPWKKIAENYLSHIKNISCLGSNAPCFTILQVIYHWLVVSTPLKRDDYSFNIWKINNVPNHQPDHHCASPLHHHCISFFLWLHCKYNIPCFQWYNMHYKPGYHYITMFVGMDTIYISIYIYGVNIHKYP